MNTRPSSSRNLLREKGRTTANATHQRMTSQRRQYQRDLADKKEDAKLSTQIARLQAQLQAEMEARKHAEDEQERLRTAKVAAPSTRVTALHTCT